MMKQRVITALWSIPLVLAAIWFDKPWFPWFSLVIAAAAILGILEFYRIAPLPRERLLTAFGVLWVLLFILSPHLNDARIMPTLLASTVLVPLIWLLCRPSKENILSNWVWSCGGVIYVGWALSLYVRLREMPQGMEWTLLALLSTFACDSAAFFVGRAWGKHPLIPTISPGKTKEGAIAGLAGAVAAVFIIGIILSPSLNHWQMALLGCLIGIFAQFGDMVESLLKRSAGVKESGRAIPGHGGMLDRLDSIIFVGIVVYYYAIWMGG